MLRFPDYLRPDYRGSTVILILDISMCKSFGSVGAAIHTQRICSQFGKGSMLS